MKVFLLSRTWNTKISASDAVIKSNPQHNRNWELKIKYLMTKNHWVKFPLITFNNSVRTISLGRSCIQKSGGIKMFQVVEMLLICVLYALLELCIMTPLKTRDGLKNPYTIGDGDFIINNGRGWGQSKPHISGLTCLFLMLTLKPSTGTNTFLCPILMGNSYFWHNLAVSL